MDLFSLLGSLLTSFTPLLIIGLIFWAAIKGRQRPTPPPAKPTNYLDAQLRQRDQEWVTFIESYEPELSSAKEKKLLLAILSDATSQGRGYSVLVDSGASRQPIMLATDAPAQVEPLEEEQPKQAPTDNAAILLYLGAFMFVASVGLFVAFAGASGPLRTLAVLIVMAVLYASGLWLYDTKLRLRQAGLAFAGMGIVIAPLVGLAAYTYVFDQRFGAIVWALTSLLCIGLYAHALVRLRYSLIGYLLIFTFLSLFESGVSIIDASIYYFGWGLAFVGLLLQLFARSNKAFIELREPSQNGSALLLPLSLLVAAAMTPMHGAGQLAVSLALAALYYGIEALRSQAVARESNTVMAHIAAVAAFASGAYAISDSWSVTAMSVVIITMLQLAFSSLKSTRTVIWRNFDSVLLGAAVIGCVPVINRPEILCFGLLNLTIIGLVLWYRQRIDAFVIGGLAYVALPYVYGQFVLGLRPPAQAVITGAALIALVSTGLTRYQKHTSDSSWPLAFAVIYLLGVVTTLGWAAYAGPIWCLAMTLGISGLSLIVAKRTKMADWIDVSALILAVPLLRAYDDRPLLLITNIIILGVLTGLSLWYRRELLRWGATAAWLLLPISVGYNHIGGDWSSATYAWAYFVVALCLLLCRAIARGVVMVSGNIPLAAYARSASLSYVFGYVGAAVLSIGISLSATESRLHTSLLLAAYASLVLLVSNVIEKRTALMSLLPILLQGFLLSMMRPAADGQALIAYLLISSALAATYYLYATVDNHKDSIVSAMVTAFITPVAVLFVGNSVWAMAIGLLVAGIIVSHYSRLRPQADREVAGLVITAGLLWLMGIAGITQVQAYVHVIILNMIAYAYWRHIRGEQAVVDQYIYATLFLATIPLGLQALGGQGGGLYGWWLLLEMVVVMLVGMAIKRRFVTMWGLYVTVGAVLYQLRNLGWAALTVLAIFLIGLAVYQLQKHDKQR